MRLLPVCCAFHLEIISGCRVLLAVGQECHVLGPGPLRRPASRAVPAHCGAQLAPSRHSALTTILTTTLTTVARSTTPTTPVCASCSACSALWLAPGSVWVRGSSPLSSTGDPLVSALWVVKGPGAASRVLGQSLCHPRAHPEDSRRRVLRAKPNTAAAQTAPGPGSQSARFVNRRAACCEAP